VQRCVSYSRVVPRLGWIKPEVDQRLTDHIALGVLTRTFPPSLVDTVIRDTGRLHRRDRLLPSRLVVYYVMALALFSDASYEEVMRNLVEGLSWASGWRRHWTVPTKPAISQARARVGFGPMQELFRRACVPLAAPTAVGAWYRNWRLMSIDGTGLDIADTPANVAEFGRPGSGRGEQSAYPQIRLAGLAECGTHAVTAVSLGAYTTGEPTLARELASSLSPEMLVLADRGLMGFPLWSQMAATGAALCWRAKVNAVFPILERLADGSFRSEMVASDDKRSREHVLSVRVIDYGIDDPGRPQATGTRYRLITTILDPEAAPASELAACYAERWELESVFDELKTHQRGPRLVLRSKTPDGVRQEVYGYLCTHYAIRALMNDTADHNDW
jgi:Insertion element 4 transposase N-terminal/Transposase DDE domain